MRAKPSLRLIFCLGGVWWVAFVLLYWRVHLSEPFALGLLALSTTAGLWVAKTGWAFERASDPRDKLRTWVNPKVRESVLRGEFVRSWVGAAGLLFGAAFAISSLVLVASPTEERTYWLSELKNCTSKCLFCSTNASVSMLSGMPTRLCVEDLDPPLAPGYRVVVRGRFAAHMSLVLEVSRGPSNDSVQ